MLPDSYHLRSFARRWLALLVGAAGLGPGGPQPAVAQRSNLASRPRSITAAHVRSASSVGARTSESGLTVTTPITTTCATPPPNLADWWPGDNATTDIQDSSSGTLQYGADYAPGLVGQAFQFDGLNDQLALPSGLLATRTEVSFEAWFKTTGQGVILGYQNTAYPQLPNSYAPALYVGTDGLLRGEFWQGQSRPIASAQPVNDGRWHHAALVAGGGSQSLYLDGSLVGTLSGNLSGSSYTVNQLGTGYSGSWPGGIGGWFAFQGLIDEPALYDRVLTENEIRAVIRAGSAGKCREISVAAITPFFQPLGQGYRVGSSVVIQAGHGSPMADATVILVATKPSGASLGFQLVTDNEGRVSQFFLSPQTGTYTFTVSAVSHHDRPYDPAQNLETSDSILVSGGRQPAAPALPGQDRYGDEFSLATSPITTTCVTPPRSLYAWWPGDGYASDIQSGYNAMLEYGATYGLGEVQQAFQLDGINDEVVLPTGLIYTRTEISFETWFKTTGDGIILSYQDSPYPEQPHYYYQPAVYVGTDGRLRAEFYQDQARPITSAGPVNDGLWHHLALVAHTTTQALFLDGAQVGTLNGRLNGHTESYNMLGIGWSNAWPATSGNWFAFDGEIDEPSLYDQPLSEAQIQAIYNAGPAGKCRPDVFVAAVNPGYQPYGSTYSVGANVQIAATNGLPAAGVNVLLDVLQPNGQTWGFVITTGSDGRAIQSFLSPQTGTYTFTVAGIWAVGRPYDPARNLETSATLTVP